MDEERIPYADQPYESKSEEETDDDSYLEDDVPIEVDSDSSAALSMTDDDFETTDPMKIDQALQQIVQGLHQAADGYETLTDILPTVQVTDVVGIVQIAPTPYLQPMSKATIQALQTLGEEHLINQACLLEFEKGISPSSLDEEVWHWPRQTVQSDPWEDLSRRNTIPNPQEGELGEG